ncbi:hypothetical protein EPUL_005170 [Erysiphe pulchra]|uniref:Uncharacterized protein n=1 Tax=Erysiphe pulchra TaxID=225359 RepID=A0A2S4PLW8_9PEZI|nr:hypothetical protein EPUL_005170 [Erysiphe pulchra]
MQPTIQNIVITANLNVPLDVKNIALHKGKYNERMNIAIIKIDKPKSTKNESDAYKACFEFEKKIGFKTHLTEFRIQNITASCNLQFPIDLYKLYGILPNSVYEPELFPALTFRLSYPKEDNLPSPIRRCKDYNFDCVINVAVSIMRLIKQNKQLPIWNIDDSVNQKQLSRHGSLLPNSIRCIICGPSNCGKTNLMLSLLYSINGLKFQNVYLFSKTIFQPKYQTLAKILNPIDEIGFYFFNNNVDVPHPSSAKSNSIFIFDDIACDKQNNWNRRFLSVSKLCPNSEAFDNANLLVLFKQDNTNIKRLYDDHVNSDMTFKEFKSLCDHCWKRKYGFIVIDKDRDMNDGRYRCGFDIANDIEKSTSNIKEKYLTLKRHLAENDEYLNRTFNPITKHLKLITDNFTNSQQSFDSSASEDFKFIMPQEASTPFKPQSIFSSATPQQNSPQVVQQFSTKRLLDKKNSSIPQKIPPSSSFFVTKR